MKMVEILRKNKLFLRVANLKLLSVFNLMILLLIISCDNKNDIAFDKKDWKNEKTPFSSSAKRKYMVKDLKKKYLNQELRLKGIIELLGLPINYEKKENDNY